MVSMLVSTMVSGGGLMGGGDGVCVRACAWLFDGGVSVLCPD